ncbi:FGGY-family carbohydrate kinase [Acidiphilium sp. PM]|uniref:xylulokinase n=1 Tax=Acidiphilium sp. PM TaxID=1043206 RepID=UPI00021450E9|nr:FGGY-family carbohydrate kinase [Acidiphilium sp. PM]EGO96758.1 XylBa [Acidiphilium sp. PM]
MGGEKYVIGIDASTQSTKAIAWTRDGHAVAEGRVAIRTDQPHPSHAEQDAETWWSSTREALRAVLAKIDPADVDAIAISDQRETMVFVDAAGRPLAPATLWIDGRAAESFRDFAEAFGAERLHRITGKQPDVIPAVYRLHWFRRHNPDLLDRAAQILDVHGFLTMRLSGSPHATHTSADPLGIFDLQSKNWSIPILDSVDISITKLPPVHAPGTVMCCVSDPGAAETGLRPGTPIVAAGGDGQCAGLGANAVRPGTVYLNLGTALVAGLWSPDPLTDRYWRTMTSPTGEGYFLEAVQRAGAFFVNWLIDNFAGGRADPNIFVRLEALASQIPVGSEGLLVLPYLTGCMDPHWNPDARAAFIGLGAHHTTAHLYHASLEALTLETARAVAAMRMAGLAAERIIAVGGGAASALWLRMFADATGLPVYRGESDEGSALGAGITAAFAVGWYETIDSAAAAMSRTAQRISPDPSTRDRWAALSSAQSKLYAATMKALQRS